MNLGIAGRSVIVTGGSKGLGRAVALALSRAHVNATFFARSAESPGAQVGFIAGQNIVNDGSFYQGLF